jgi:hypothetical protein
MTVYYCDDHSESTVRKNRRYRREEADTMSAVQEPDLVCDVTTRPETVSTASVLGRESSSSETQSSVIISPMSIGEFYKESIQSDIHTEVNSLFEEIRSNNRTEFHVGTSAVKNDQDADCHQDEQRQDVEVESSVELSPAIDLSSADKTLLSDTPPPDLVILPSGLRSAFQLEIKQVLQRRSAVNQPKTDSSSAALSSGTTQSNTGCSPDSLMSAILNEVASRQQTRDSDVAAVNDSHDKSR